MPAAGARVMATIDMPIFSITLHILKFWSYLFVHNWRRYLAIVPYVLMNSTQYFDIYQSTDPLNFIIRNVYVAVLFTNTIIRALLLCVQRGSYERFLELFKGYYVELLSESDVRIRQLVSETENLARTIATVNLLMGFCSGIGFVTYPIFVSDRVMPFGMYLPGVDKNTSPYYEIFFAVQVVMAPIGCCIYIPYSNLVVAFTLFAILMCRVLQHKLRSLSAETSAAVQARLVWCIEYHLKLIRFVSEMNKLTTNLYLAEFICFGAMLCMLLFCMIISNTLTEMVIMCAYVVTIFCNSAVLYYVANELYFESLNVSIAAYECDWMDFDVESQKSLQLLILRSQTPCAVLVGGVYPMNLKMLQSLLNSIYTFFTLLRRVYG